MQAVGIGPDGEGGGDVVFQRGLARGGRGAEVVHHALGHVVQVDLLKVEGDLAGFQAGDGQQILDEKKEAVGMFVYFLQEAGGLFGIVHGAVEQRLGEAFDEGKRGAQFVADVADKFLADAFQFLEAGDIVKNKELALGAAGVVADQGGADLPGAARAALQCPVPPRK